MSAFTSGDLVNSVVADIGSYATKIGFAGEDSPRSYFRSVGVLYLFMFVLLYHLAGFWRLF